MPPREAADGTGGPDAAERARRNARIGRTRQLIAACEAAAAFLHAEIEQDMRVLGQLQEGPETLAGRRRAAVADDVLGMWKAADDHVTTLRGMLVIRHEELIAEDLRWADEATDPWLRGLHVKAAGQLQAMRYPWEVRAGE